jgi:hypothetical protein
MRAPNGEESRWSSGSSQLEAFWVAFKDISNLLIFTLAFATIFASVVHRQARTFILEMISLLK